MKTVAEPTFVETSNIGETKKASIKTSAKMFNFFSKQIYSDFYTAVWRELVANGIDGQKVNGNTTSPVVTVPSILEPYAKVRDFGCSMSHEFMMNQFMAFGDASTKEDSDDFIGGFGIGSKAPLSYTDQYSIRCFKDGVVRVYSVFKDAEGCPSIAFLSESDTSEPDGVEVGFPVRQDDISKFSETVVRTLQYFDPQPVLENTDLKLTPIQYDARGAKWGLRTPSPDRRPNVIIGGIAYPLDTTKVHYQFQRLRSFGHIGLDVYLEIGEANIALSREHITHDEELFTKLEELVLGIGEEYSKQLANKFSNCKTSWEAKEMLSNLLKGADHNTASLIRRHAVYKGQSLDCTIRRPDKFEVLVICYGNFGYQSGLSGMPSTVAISPKFRTWSSHTHFGANTFDRIIIDDTDINKDKPALRIRAAIEKNEGRILFLRWNDTTKPVDWKAYLEALGSPPDTMIEKLSSYQALKIARSTSSGATRAFKCYTGSSRPYRGSHAYDALPAGGGLYIEMDNFSPNESSARISLAHMINPKNVVWLNKTDFIASGLKKHSDWFSVDEAIEAIKKNYKSKHKNLELAQAVSQWTGDLKDFLPKLSKLSNFPKRGPLQKLWKLKNQFESVDSLEHIEMRKLLEVKCEKQRQDIDALLREVRAKHPLLMEVVGKWELRRYASDNLLNALF